MAIQPAQPKPAQPKPAQLNMQQSGSSRSSGQMPRRLPDRISVRRLFVALIEQMIRHRPLVFWSAVWMVPLLMAIVAATALMTPEYAAQKPLPPPPPLSPAPTARSTSPVQAVSTTSTAIVPADRLNRSLWSLGAIAFTCATGSVVISRWLNRPQIRPRLTAKEIPAVRIAKPAQAPLPSATVQGSAARVSRSTQPNPHVLPSKLQSAAVLTHQFTYQPNPQDAVAPLKVSIVPSSESHPLDWSEDSLADSMDIRKRRSLSSWL